MGTPEFGAIILEGLIKGGYKPILVIAAPDKPVGRKQIITPPSVKVIAQKHNIPILQPEKILDSKSQILDSKPDLIVVAAYGEILPKEILEVPKYSCLNVHPSLLPRWRGPSPIQFSILEDDDKTGISIIKMTEKVDAGPILAQKEIKIGGKETYNTLHNKLAGLGAELLIETISKWIKGEIKEKLQDESKANYTKVLKKEDGKIDWQKSAEEIERQIRAYSPWPGTYTMANNKILKILNADVLKQTKNGPFGIAGKTFLASNDKIAVQTGKDFLIISELQLEGKKIISAKDFLRGHPDFIGTILQWKTGRK